HHDEHPDLSRPRYPARVDGFIDGLDRAIPRDELRHCVGHPADAGPAEGTCQRGLCGRVSLDRLAAGVDYGRGESRVRPTAIRQTAVNERRGSSAPSRAVHRAVTLRSTSPDAI